jgi:hypothetical protein
MQLNFSCNFNILPHGNTACSYSLFDEAESRYSHSARLASFFTVPIAAVRLRKLSTIAVVSARSVQQVVRCLSAQKEHHDALQFLNVEMGLHLKDVHVAAQSKVNLTEDEIYAYVKRFQTLDSDNKGFLTVSDLRRYFKVCDLLTDSRTSISRISQTICCTFNNRDCYIGLTSLLNELTEFIQHFYNTCWCLHEWTAFSDFFRSCRIA